MHPVISCLLFHFQLILIFMQRYIFALKSSYNRHSALQPNIAALNIGHLRGKPVSSLQLKILLGSEQWEPTALALYFPSCKHRKSDLKMWLLVEKELLTTYFSHNHGWQAQQERPIRVRAAVGWLALETRDVRCQHGCPGPCLGSLRSWCSTLKPGQPLQSPTRSSLGKGMLGNTSCYSYL